MIKISCINDSGIVILSSEIGKFFGNLTIKSLTGGDDLLDDASVSLVLLEKHVVSGVSPLLGDSFGYL